MNSNEITAEDSVLQMYDYFVFIRESLGRELTGFEMQMFGRLWFGGRGIVLKDEPISFINNKEKAKILSLFSCAIALVFPKMSIGYYTPQVKQWDDFWDHVGDFCIDSEIKRTSYSVVIRFSNGSFIQSFVLSDRMYGIRHNIVILDGHKFDKDMINTVVLPFLAIGREDRKNQIIYVN